MWEGALLPDEHFPLLALPQPHSPLSEFTGGWEKKQILPTNSVEDRAGETEMPSAPECSQTQSGDGGVLRGAPGFKVFSWLLCSSPASVIHY